MRWRRVVRKPDATEKSRADELGRRADELIPILASETSGLHSAKVLLRNALMEEIIQRRREK